MNTTKNKYTHRLTYLYGYSVCCTDPVTESREYGNPIPSQNASLTNNYNITSAVHNCMCAFQFTRALYAPQIC